MDQLLGDAAVVARLLAALEQEHDVLTQLALAQHVLVVVVARVDGKHLGWKPPGRKHVSDDRPTQGPCCAATLPAIRPLRPLRYSNLARTLFRSPPHLQAPGPIMNCHKVTRDHNSASVSGLATFKMQPWNEVLLDTLAMASSDASFPGYIMKVARTETAAEHGRCVPVLHCGVRAGGHCRTETPPLPVLGKSRQPAAATGRAGALPPPQRPTPPSQGSPKAFSPAPPRRHTLYTYAYPTPTSHAPAVRSLFQILQTLTPACRPDPCAGPAPIHGSAPHPTFTLPYCEYPPSGTWNRYAPLLLSLLHRPTGRPHLQATKIIQRPYPTPTSHDPWVGPHPTCRHLSTALRTRTFGSVPSE